MYYYNFFKWHLQITNDWVLFIIVASEIRIYVINYKCSSTVGQGPILHFKERHNFIRKSQINYILLCFISFHTTLTSQISFIMHNEFLQFCQWHLSTNNIHYDRVLFLILASEIRIMVCYDLQMHFNLNCKDW